MARELLVGAGYSATIRWPAKGSLEMPLFRRGLRDRLGERKNAAKMPKSLRRAILWRIFSSP